MLDVADAAHRALAVEALTAAGIDPADENHVGWDNLGLEPPAGTDPWATVTLVPGTPTSAWEGFASGDAATYMPQVTLYVPPDEGNWRLKQLVGALEATYRKNRDVPVVDEQKRPLGTVRVRDFTPGQVIAKARGNWTGCICRATLDVLAGRPGLATDPATPVRLVAA